MKIKHFLPVCLMILMVILISCESNQETKPLSQAELVQHGAYLVQISGCNDCHSPKKMTPNGPMPDEALLLSGHPHDVPMPAVDTSQIGPGKWVLMSGDLTAFVGPWGMSFAANLTPDKQTGLGLWTEENF